MMNFGVYTAVAVNVQELRELGEKFGGVSDGQDTLRFGYDLSDGVYLRLSSDLSEGCFDSADLLRLKRHLGFDPMGYVSVHMNPTKRAMSLALDICEMISEKWRGKIDYSGAFGNVEDPFDRPEHLFTGLPDY